MNLATIASRTPWRSLQVRLLGVLVLTVVIALATVALVARASTTTEFERYVQANQLQMQDIAKQIAASTGDRLLVTSAQGRVIVDSSGELGGRMVTPDMVAQLDPLPVPRPPDVLFVRRTASSQETVTWTRALPVPLLMCCPFWLWTLVFQITASRSSSARSRVHYWLVCSWAAGSPWRWRWRSRGASCGRSVR